MPFNCFRCNNIYTTSRRYHTAAKQSAAFFDSTFNHIKQNSQVIASETITQGAKRTNNPHPVNSVSANYLQLDYTSIANDTDDNKHCIKNHSLAIALPFNQENFNLSSTNRSEYQQLIKKLPLANQPIPTLSTNNASSFTSKLNTPFQKINYHHTQSNPLPSSTTTTTATAVGVASAAAASAAAASAASASAASARAATAAVGTGCSASAPQKGQSLSPSYSSPTLVESQDVSKYFEPIFESPQEQNDETFLASQIQEIEFFFKKRQFERIHSHYLALKRNGLIPSRDIYAKILYSIGQRTIDESLDEQLSVMLNVYQDMISNKIKPDLNIYSVVINHLLDASIKSAFSPSSSPSPSPSPSPLSHNGADFFKIAIDIFNASNCHHIQQFDSHLFNQILLGMNLYPGFVNGSSLVKILEQQHSFTKSKLYYSALINYCKFTSDSKFAVRLYEEFKQSSSENEDLTQNQFLIYSCFISTLIETNEIPLATKFLDKLLTSIKNYQDYESKVTMLLSSYLLTLSKQNPFKAIEIWAQFNRIDWIPEFSYDFYSNLLHDSLADYKTALKLYNYMTALPQHNAKNSTNYNNITNSPNKANDKSNNITSLDHLLIPTLLTPQNHSALSKFLLTAIKHKDRSTVLKLLKESFVRKTSFTIETYDCLFKYIDNEELITKITNSHGLLMHDGFEFLSYLTANVPDLPLRSIFGTEFIKRLIDEYSLEKIQNYTGFYKVLQSIIDTQTSQTSNLQKLKTLELLSPLIIEFYDVSNYYLLSDHPAETTQFKDTLALFFSKMLKEPNTKSGMSRTALDAMALVEDLCH